MKDLNRIELIGRIGQDPEVKDTQGGAKVATLSVATTSSFKRGDEWVDHTYWHKVTVWNATAEFSGKYLVKGCLVHIEGELRYQSWEDDNGNKRVSAEIHASELRLLSSPPGKAAGKGKNERDVGNSRGRSAKSDSEDVPF